MNLLNQLNCSNFIQFAKDMEKELLDLKFKFSVALVDKIFSIL